MKTQMTRGTVKTAGLLCLLLGMSPTRGLVAEEMQPEATLSYGRPYLVFEEWHVDLVLPYGLLVWRVDSEANDTSPFHVLFIEHTSNVSGNHRWVWSGTDIGKAIIKASFQLDIPLEDFVEGRGELADYVGSALHGSRTQDFWMAIGDTVSIEVAEFSVAYIHRIASAVGILRTNEVPQIEGNISPIPACPIDAYLTAMPSDNNLESVIYCIRVTPWVCTTGPVVFESSTPSAGSFYCNYSQTTVCTATEQCAWVICDLTV